MTFNNDMCVSTEASYAVGLLIFTFANELWSDRGDVIQDQYD